MREQHPPCPRIALSLLLAAAALQLAAPSLWPAVPALPGGGLAAG